MAHDLMTQCEQKKQFVSGGKRVWKWVQVPVAKLYDAPRSHIRCMHCHGAVRVHKQQVAHGPQDHVEHLSRADSKNCKGGHYFDGSEHRMSLQPIE